MAFGIATHLASCNLKTPVSAPISINDGSIKFNAVFVGRPTAPKLTGTLFNTSATIAAHNGGNPRLISKGAARAAGVP